MKNLIKFTILVSTVFILCFSATAQSNTKEKKAVAAADAWLELIDNGEYGKSWEDSAVYFRNEVNKSHWKRQLSAVRKPLGQLISRKLKSSRYLSSLPGAPDGEYVVILYKTSFDNKRSAIETVTPMKEADGSWKVSGYYIK